MTQTDLANICPAKKNEAPAAPAADASPPQADPTGQTVRDCGGRGQNGFVAIIPTARIAFAFRGVLITLHAGTVAHVEPAVLALLEQMEAPFKRV